MVVASDSLHSGIGHHGRDRPAAAKSIPVPRGLDFTILDPGYRPGFANARSRTSTRSRRSPRRLAQIESSSLGDASFADGFIRPALAAVRGRGEPAERSLLWRPDIWCDRGRFAGIFLGPSPLLLSVSRPGLSIICSIEAYLGCPIRRFVSQPEVYSNGAKIVCKKALKERNFRGRSSIIYGR